MPRASTSRRSAAAASSSSPAREARTRRFAARSTGTSTERASIRRTNGHTNDDDGERERRSDSEDIDVDAQEGDSALDDRDPVNEDPEEQEEREQPAAEEVLDTSRDTFYITIYALVRLIPAGRVTTYGHLAKLAGRPRNSRLVGQALKFLPRRMGIPPEELPPLPAGEAVAGAPDPLANGAYVPWHRVINSRGVISARGSIQAVRRQADRLRDEGVEVDEDGEVDPNDFDTNNAHDAFALGAMEGGRISLRRFGWFPESVQVDV